MKRILFVDDEKGFTDTLKATFEPRGFDCLTAGNGIEALKLAREKKPSLIILDLIMPEMDGVETYKTLKADGRTKNIPIIVYTAQAPEVVAKKDDAFDVVNILLKPFNTKELISLVQKAVKGNE